MNIENEINPNNDFSHKEEKEKEIKENTNIIKQKEIETKILEMYNKDEDIIKIIKKENKKLKKNLPKKNRIAKINVINLDNDNKNIKE